MMGTMVVRRFILGLIPMGLTLSALPCLSQEVPTAFIRMGNGRYFSKNAFLVDKSARKLTVWSLEGDSIVKSAEYPSDLGKKTGDKTAEGDHRTPEGIYFFQKMLEGPSLAFNLYGVRAFPLDYPNVFDQRQGKTGDGIWLHAIPDTETLERGSRGCVVVRNDSILALSPYITLKRTPILIFDHVQTTQASALQARKLETDQWLSQWKRTWESKDLNAYMAFYSEQFESLSKNKAQWKDYKSGLAGKSGQIQINIGPSIAFGHDGKTVIKFLQHYKSETLEDYGEKTIYLSQENGTNRIISEQWEPLSSPEVYLSAISDRSSEAQSKAPASADTAKN
ncbi:MAG: L,D-transpeptidase family protein [Bdellovibrionales bacterium]|nr:L,D-transpeptidase family protein [Bdellovibrionales bacterium]